MCDTDTLEEAIDAYTDLTLAQIGEAIDFDDDIGAKAIVASETIIDPDQVASELEKLGNDGTFFECSLGRGEFAGR